VAGLLANIPNGCPPPNRNL